MKYTPFFVLALFLLSLSATQASDGEIDQIREKMAERLPDIPVSSVRLSPVAGIYELVSDGQIYYVSADGDYIFDGDLIDMSRRINLTSARKGGLHLEMINAVAEDQMLIYEPKDASDRSITVFTDISCGYCRKLHQEINDLLDGGVRVRYLMFPRAGLQSQAARDLESVWCAEDPQTAMTNAKAGGKIDPLTCATPIESHVRLAEQVGLRGTPLIYLDNGQMIPGYRSAKQLVEMVQSSEPL